MNKKNSAIAAFAAVLLTIAAVWYGQRPVSLQLASWDDVAAEAKAGNYELISTEGLAELYNKNTSDILLVDTRQEWEYRSGHIAGAVNFPMEPTWWARWSESDELEEFLGPDKDRPLVFY